MYANHFFGDTPRGTLKHCQTGLARYLYAYTYRLRTEQEWYVSYFGQKKEENIKGPSMVYLFSLELVAISEIIRESS